MSNSGKAVEVEVPNEPVRVSELRMFVVHYLRKLGIPDDAAAEIILAVDEAATNACLHASSPGAGTISVRCEQDGDRLKIVVSDDGRGFDPASEDLRSPGEPLDLHGRGLFLIHELMDSVAIDSGSHGTTISMVRYLPEPRDFVTR